MRVAGVHVGLTCENAFGGRNRDTRVTREPVVGPGLPWFDHGPCSGSVTVSPSGQTSQGRTSSCWPRSTSGTLATWTPAWLRRSATWFETQSGPASRPRLSGEKPQKDLCYQVRNRLRSSSHVTRSQWLQLRVLAMVCLAATHKMNVTASFGFPWDPGTRTRSTSRRVEFLSSARRSPLPGCRTRNRRPAQNQ